MSPHLKLEKKRSRGQYGFGESAEPNTVDSNQCTENRTPSVVNGTTAQRKNTICCALATIPLAEFLCFSFSFLLEVVVRGRYQRKSKLLARLAEHVLSSHRQMFCVTFAAALLKKSRKLLGSIANFCSRGQILQSNPSYPLETLRGFPTLTHFLQTEWIYDITI